MHPVHQAARHSPQGWAPRIQRSPCEKAQTTPQKAHIVHYNHQHQSRCPDGLIQCELSKIKTRVHCALRTVGVEAIIIIIISFAIMRAYAAVRAVSVSVAAVIMNI